MLQARRRRGGPPLLLPGLAAAGKGGAAPYAKPLGRLHAQHLVNRDKLPYCVTQQLLPPLAHYSIRPVFTPYPACLTLLPSSHGRTPAGSGRLHGHHSARYHAYASAGCRGAQRPRHVPVSTCVISMQNTGCTEPQRPRGCARLLLRELLRILLQQLAQEGLALGQLGRLHLLVRGPRLGEARVPGLRVHADHLRAAPSTAADSLETVSRACPMAICNSPLG